MPAALDADDIASWKDEVAYARFRLNMTLDQLLAHLSGAEENLSPADMKKLEDIARSIYSLQ